MDETLNKEAPNVVTEALFRTLLEMGNRARILCEEDAYLKSAVWYGSWTARVVSGDGSLDKRLVAHPRGTGEDQEIRIKIFRTINGLASFMHRMGFTDFNIPFYEGGVSVQCLPLEEED